MKRTKINSINWKGALIVLLLLPFLGASSLLADDYDISWSTIDGGGGTSTGGNYSLSGTIGQPDAGEMAGGDYVLAGGFWSGWIACWVDLPELERFLTEWLLKESEVGHPLDADLNHDGEVNLADYNLFVGSWLRYCPDNWPSW